MSKGFDIRMLYAITPQAREKAAEMGCNWVCSYTMGHKRHRSLENPLPNDDLPIYLGYVPKVSSLRQRNKRKAVEFERRILRESVEHAHRLGMKAMIHSYEVSLPHELKEVFPSLYRPMVREYRNCSEETRMNREPCLADPRVRELISNKIAETVSVVPELDAYAFSFNESLSLTKARHRCELCREIPFWQMIKWLSDAVREGLHSVNPDILFFHRLWGVQEHDDNYHRNLERIYEFQKGDIVEKWLATHVKVYAPRKMRYVPSIDLRKYLHLQRNVKMGFVAKATWADVSIDMPPNPWIRELKGHDTVVELSFEAASRPKEFHVLARQFQRMARYSRSCGCAGIAGIPVDWGDKYNENPPDRGFQTDSFWRLSLLNFDVIEALMKDPDADMLKAVEKGLHKRYGAKLPRKIAEYILQSQSLMSRTVNVRGIRATGKTLDEIFQQILRYGPTVKGWQKLISRNPANVKRILKEKDVAIRRASDIVSDLRNSKGSIPEKAYADFMTCFSLLEGTVKSQCNRHKFNFLLWAIKDGKMPCDIRTIHEIEKCV